jgi:hypothetical protein
VCMVVSAQHVHNRKYVLVRFVSYQIDDGHWVGQFGLCT